MSPGKTNVHYFEVELVLVLFPLLETVLRTLSSGHFLASCWSGTSSRPWTETLLDRPASADLTN